MKHTGAYYEFWIQSSRGTNSTHVRRFKTVPQKAQLKEFVENWIDGFSATHVSENHVSYGWRKLTEKDLPKNRADALKQHQRFYKQEEKWHNKRCRVGGLLSCFPFNGGKENDI